MKVQWDQYVEEIYYSTQINKSGLKGNVMSSWLVLHLRLPTPSSPCFYDLGKNADAIVIPNVRICIAV